MHAVAVYYGTSVAHHRSKNRAVDEGAIERERRKQSDSYFEVNSAVSHITWLFPLAEDKAGSVIFAATTLAIARAAFTLFLQARKLKDIV